jgi:hypothetical protein
MVIFLFQLLFLLARTSDRADSEAPPQPVALGHDLHASDASTAVTSSGSILKRWPGRG